MVGMDGELCMTGMGGIIEEGVIKASDARLPELEEAWMPGGGTYLDLGFEPVRAMFGAAGVEDDVGSRNSPGWGGPRLMTGGGPSEDDC